MYTYAEQLGGLAVSLEHRYFGESLPFGPNTSWTSPAMKYLTLDNVMADAVNFIGMLKKTVSGASTSKVFVASGMILYSVYSGPYEEISGLIRRKRFLWRIPSNSVSAKSSGYLHRGDCFRWPCESLVK
jgi:serine carboxypeptidase S28